MKNLNEKKLSFFQTASFKKVFGLYFVFILGFTFFHINKEKERIQNEMNSSINEYLSSISFQVANAVKNNNQAQMTSLLDKSTSFSLIGKISLKNNSNKVLHSKGDDPLSKGGVGKVVISDESGNSVGVMEYELGREAFHLRMGKRFLNILIPEIIKFGLLLLLAGFFFSGLSFSEESDQSEKRSDDEGYKKLLETKIEERTQDLVRVGNLVNNLERDKRKAESASKAKSEFLWSISQEIKTPLKVMTDYTSDLKSGKEMTQENKKYLYDYSTNLLHFFDDLGKIFKGELREGYHSYSNIVDILSMVKDKYRKRAKEKGIDFIIDLDLEMPPSVKLGGGIIFDILDSLLDNAFNYTTKGHVRFSIFTDKGTDFGGSCNISMVIEDSGIGVSEDEVEKIFMPFFRGERSGEFSIGPGTGLSLALKMIEGLGGTIFVDSSEGKGSEFSLYFPNVNYESYSEKEGKELQLHLKALVSTVEISDEDQAKMDNMAKEYISEDILPHLSDLINELEGEVFTLWFTASDSLTISELEDFAEKLADVGLKYKYRPLRDLSEKIKQQTKSLEMDALAETLEEFPELMDVLKSKLTSRESA